jgi:hypothetical protein
MKKKKTKQEISDNRVRKSIKRYGHVYHLVAAGNRENTRFNDPCFMGESGFALEGCAKIQSV